MFQHIALTEPTLNNFNMEDLWIEYDESELYENFCEFYYDLVPELERYGSISKLVITRNLLTFLRGNVYVEYKR
ncbi:unnamed protein product [Soboliphyme baturini]|uniref:MCM_N domain-containing protein n=1 Tax=Soboliphyme baturini TaxID=241478 RepID=A0A183IXN6_9BILA|nr:unnamed protein product [Soboliphyme baturini]